MNHSTHTRNALIFFVLLTFALSSIFYVLLARQGSMQTSGGLFTLLLMWCPGVSAFIVRQVMKVKEPGIGWRPGKASYLALGYLLPVGYSLVVYGFVWLTGIAPFQNKITPQLIGFVVVGSVVGILSSLGEEIGWRGFLVPNLAKLTSFSGTALISGAIWALWHYVPLLTTDYNRATPGFYSLAMFTMTVIGMSFIYTWLRLKSNSIWPAVLLHTSHNVFVLNFFDPLTAQTPLAPYFVSETGAGLLVVTLLILLAGWALSRRNPGYRVPAENPAVEA